jgi:hypothetical protein
VLYYRFRPAHFLPFLEPLHPTTNTLSSKTFQHVSLSFSGFFLLVTAREHPVGARSAPQPVQALTSDLGRAAYGWIQQLRAADDLPRHPWTSYLLGNSHTSYHVIGSWSIWLCQFEITEWLVAVVISSMKDWWRCHNPFLHAILGFHHVLRTVCIPWSATFYITSGTRLMVGCCNNDSTTTSGT